MYDNIEINEEDFNILENSRIPISLSYSRLSDFDRNGPIALIERTVEDSYALSFGAAVDEILMPSDDTSFEDKFIITDFEKPSATSGKLVDVILSNYTEMPSDEEMLKICENSQFWASYSDDKILETIKDNKVKDYLEIEFQRHVKHIISTKTYMDARNLADILRVHKYSKHIFINNHENINKFLLEFKIDGIVFKGEIDKLIINHDDKTIQIVDLKTGKASYDQFFRSFLMYRYYLQSYLYTKALEKLKEEMGLEDYTILPFKFLYIGRSEKIPIIYTVSEDWLNAAENGFTCNGYSYNGYKKIIEDIIWHFDHNLYDLPREVFEKEGILELKSDFININQE